LGAREVRYIRAGPRARHGCRMLRGRHRSGGAAPADAAPPAIPGVTARL